MLIGNRRLINSIVDITSATVKIVFRGRWAISVDLPHKSAWIESYDRNLRSSLGTRRLAPRFLLKKGLSGW